MDKKTVTIGFDGEKIDALRVYLGHKNTYLEVELVKAMDQKGIGCIILMNRNT